MWSGMVLHIICQRCSRSRSEWAHRLFQRKPSAKTMALNQSIAGFYCQACKRSVMVYISAHKEGEL